MVVKIEYFSDMFSKQWWSYGFYDDLMDKTISILTGNICVFTGVKPGHMPSAVHLPYPSILDPDTKLMKTPEQLKNTFQEAGVNVEQPLVASCGSGKGRSHGDAN